MFSSSLSIDSFQCKIVDLINSIYKPDCICINSCLIWILCLILNVTICSLDSFRNSEDELFTLFRFALRGAILTELYWLTLLRHVTLQEWRIILWIPLTVLLGKRGRPPYTRRNLSFYFLPKSNIKHCLFFFRRSMHFRYSVYPINFNIIIRIIAFVKHLIEHSTQSDRLYLFRWYNG